METTQSNNTFKNKIKKLRIKTKKIRYKVKYALGWGNYTNQMDKIGITVAFIRIWLNILLWRNKKICSGNGPIFIVGSPHSGTSIMLKILSNHPNIYAVSGESKIFFKSFTFRIVKITSWYIHICREDQLRWAEKTPSHLHKIKTIFSYFPDAKIIAMVRDGRDVACSLKARYGDFDCGLNIWVEENKALEKYLSDTRVLQVKYEDLVKKTNSKLGNIFDFLGEKRSHLDKIKDTASNKIRWYSNILEKPESPEKKTHEQYRNWQINQPLFDGSGRWKLDMSEEERIQFKQHAATQLLRSLGYVSEQDW